MKSWKLENVGRENLHLVEIPKPQPGPKDILVQTQAVSLNFRDKAILEGTYPVPLTFPLVLGGELAGEVVAVGPQVTRFKPGDKVVSVYKPLWLDGIPTLEAIGASLGGPLPGVLEEYTLLSEDGALHYPEYLSPAQASTISIAGVTAWVALFDQGSLRSDQSVLVQGTGGVSLYGLQIAQAQGARVIATTRSKDKVRLLRDLGADEIIDTSATTDWDKEAKRLTGGKGVDYVLDVVGGDFVQRSINASAWGGHVAIIGFMEASTSNISLPSMLFTCARVQGLSVGSRKHMVDLLAFMDQHKIEPVIDARYSFEDLPQALDHLDRGPFGKIIVEVR